MEAVWGSCRQGIAARESSLHDPGERMRASPASSEAVHKTFRVWGRGISFARVRGLTV